MEIPEIGIRNKGVLHSLFGKKRGLLLSELLLKEMSLAKKSRKV
jgi:hypothetical protein